MRGRNRHGYARRAYRRTLRRFLVRNRYGLLTLTAGYALIMVVLGLVQDAYVLGLAQGAFTVAFVAMVLIGFMAATGSMWQMTGAWGEDNTRDVLRWAKRRGLVFGWVDNVEVEGGDVDHLVATSSGWIALDSKWHSVTLDGRVVARDAERTIKAARRAALILRSLNHPAPVRPVAILWGGSRDEIPDKHRVAHDVEFVSGSYFKQWLRELPSGGSDKAAAEAVLRELRAFRDTVRPGDKSLLTRGR